MWYAFYSLSHFRLDGNIDIGTTCCICHEEITSFVNLTGKRCVWCQRVVHEYPFPCVFYPASECASQLAEFCDFGKFKNYIISPSFVRSFYSKPSNPESPIPEKIPFVPTSPPSSTSRTLVRSMSDHSSSTSSFFSTSSAPLFDPSTEEELRFRKSRGSFDDDSVGGSPPPSLTEYKPREDSCQFDAEDKKEEARRSRKFSWQSVFTEMK